MKKLVNLLFTVASLLITLPACAQSNIGVDAEPPADATVLFNGSREMLDDKWTYWEGPRLAASMPIKWQIEDSPVGDGTVMNSNDPAAAGGLYGAADIVTKQKFSRFSATRRVFD